MILNKIKGEPQINKIIGMEEKEAIIHLSKINKSMRVINKDGVPIMIKGIEIDMDRVNVFVSNGIIVNLDGLG